MANQVLLKVRGLIVTANQAIVPYAATLEVKGSTHINSMYIKNMQLISFVTIPVFSILLAWAGGFSWLLIGVYQPEFILLLRVLAIAWIINIFVSFMTIIITK